MQSRDIGERLPVGLTHPTSWWRDQASLPFSRWSWPVGSCALNDGTCCCYHAQWSPGALCRCSGVPWVTLSHRHPSHLYRTCTRSRVWLSRRAAGRLQHHDRREPRPRFALKYDPGLWWATVWFFWSDAMPHLITFHFPNGSGNLRLIKPIRLALQPFLHSRWRDTKELRNKPVRRFPKRIQDHRTRTFHWWLRFHAVIPTTKL